MKIPRSLERIYRTAGAALVGAVAPLLIPTLTGLVPAPWGALAGPVINGLFKELRIRHPNNVLLKALPL